MPNTREKLIELLDEASEKLRELCGGLNDHNGNGVRADHLIANGVTVQKWIPVTERLPHELLTVIIAVPNGKRTDVMPAYLANGWWKASNDWCYETDKVSHWMHLPEPPKGE